MSEEVWKPVVGYEGLYEVSSHGRVKSLDRIMTSKTGLEFIKPGRMLKLIDIKPYRAVNLAIGGKSKMHRVHSLVAQAFIGPLPEGGVVRHWDDDGANNHLSNLLYGSKKDNAQDAIRNGKNPWLRKTHCLKGHPYSEENTWYNKKGHRRCVKCSVASDERRKARAAA